VRDHFVVWLQADPETLAARAARDGLESRPLLAGGDPVVKLRRLGGDRAFAYAEAADATVTTDGREADEVAHLVVALLAGADA
jgi:shikimate kinase / 3-dehydroquinate synthase